MLRRRAGSLASRLPGQREPVAVDRDLAGTPARLPGNEPPTAPRPRNLPGSLRAAFRAGLLAALAAGPALAQTAPTFLSNTAETFTTGLLDVGRTARTEQAVRFATSGPGAYLLSSVSVHINQVNTGGSLTVQLRSSAGVNTATTPGAVVATFTGPATLGTGIQTFTAPANTYIGSSGSYWISFATTSSGDDIRLRRNSSTGSHADTGSASGWSIHGRSYKDNSSQTTWRPISTSSSFYHPRVAFRGHQVAVKNTTATALTSPNYVGGFDRTERAIRFSVGDHRLGYALSAVAFDIQAVSSGASLTVQLRSSMATTAGNTVPGDLVATFTSPATLGTGLQTFTAPPGLVVGASGTYWLTLSLSTRSQQDSVGIHVNPAAASHADAGGVAGWSFHGESSKTTAAPAWTNASDTDTVTFNHLRTLIMAAPRTGSTLVSNIGQTSTSSISGTSNKAQVFRTGSNPDGYALDSIDVVSADAAGDSFAASLYTLTSGLPGTEVAALVAPGSFAAGTLTFTAPAGGTRLAASTDYAVVLSLGGNNLELGLTSSNGEDSGAAAGWSIANSALQVNSGTWGAGSANSHRIAVKGVINPRTATGPDAPAAPAVAAVSGSTASLAVSWIAPNDYGSAITGYDLRYRQDGSTDWTNGPQDVSGTSATIAGLAANTTYQVQVRATNGEGDSGWSDSGSGTTNALDGTLLSNTAQTLSGSVSVGGATSVQRAVGFRVGPHLFNYTLDSVSLQIASAPSGSALTVELRNSVGTTVSSTPGDLLATFTAPTTFGTGTQTFTAPPSTTVQTGIAYWITVAIASGSQTVTLAANAAGWSFHGMSTKNTAGQTSWAGAGTTATDTFSHLRASLRGPDPGVTLLHTLLTAGTHPNDSTAFGYGDSSQGNSVFGSFSPATFTHAGTDYTINWLYRIGGVLILRTTPALSAAARNGLALYIDGNAFPLASSSQPGTDANVRRWDNTGLSFDSGDDVSVGLFYRVSSAPAAPSVAAVSGSTTSLAVSWTAPSDTGGSPITGYDLQYRQGTSGDFTAGPQDVTGTSSTITGLAANTLYQVQVRATNVIGDSAWSASGSGTTNAADTTPPALESIFVIQSGGAIQLRFSENLQLSNLPPASAFAVTADGSAISVTAVGITGFDQDRLRVGFSPLIRQGQAVVVTYTDPTASDDANAIQDLLGNDTPDFTTGSGGVPAVTNNSTQAATAPGAPAGLSAAADGSSTIDLSWTAPADNGGRAITGYKIEWSADGSAPWTVLVASTGSTATTYSDTGLSPGTTRHYRVSAINAIGTSGTSNTDSATTAAANNPPVFDTAAVSRSVAENTAAGQNVGAAVTATDADTGDTLAYTLGGADAASFAIVAASGQIRTRSGVTYDHEAKVSYAVTVTASDGTATADATVTISVTDVNEPPAAPGAPSVTAVSGSTTSLTVSWNAPANAGKPAIASYAVRYRQSGDSNWTNGPQDLTGTSATITGLAENTPYQAQVRATNAEGDSGWSPSGSGRTNAADNNAPVFVQPSVTRTVAENTASGQNIGSPVSATDADGDTLAYSLLGSDSAPFAINGSTGQIRTDDPLDFETEPSYSFQVEADDGNGGISTAAVRIDLINVAELPGAPSAPTVTATAGSDTSLDAAWAAPTNTGPPVSSYDLRYHVGTSGGWTDGPQARSGTSATLAGLDSNTLYEVQVRATNSDGDSGWSASGSARTNAPGNRAPAFPGSSATRDLPENSPGGTAAGTPVSATDRDTGDTLSYTLEGDDADSFSVDSGTGQVRAGFGASFDHEARSRYAVRVKADDGNGGTDTIAVSIRVTDEPEPPAAPSSPAVSPVDGSAASVEVTWSRRASPGRPHVSSYDLRYRPSGEQSWRNGPQNRLAARAEIGGLEAGASYQVQVRATNAEGDSEWSGSGSGAPHGLAVRVARAPARHAGSASFAVRFQFSAEITIDDEAAFRDSAARVAGGSVTAARRVAGNLWEVTLQPDSGGAVVVSLFRGGGCNGPGALCTAGGEALSHDLDHAVPGPDTATVTIRAVSAAVTEGAPAAFELRRAGPAPDGALTVSLAALRAGDLLLGSPPTSATFATGNATVRLEIATDDDSVPEPGGYLLYRLQADGSSPPAYVLGAAREAAVQVRDNDGGPPPPPPPLRRAVALAGQSSARAPRDPVPLQLALWTERPGYRSGETVRLRYTLDPHDDRDEYHARAYLEPAGGGERRYIAPLAAAGGLRGAAVDFRGVPAAAARARHLEGAEKALAWEGVAPAAGLWQFVMELHPWAAADPDDGDGPDGDDDPSEAPGVRKAWAKFTVADRSQLLIRRGLDREVETGLTLRSGGFYYLMGQLFVQAGATLTIEPGTVVQAWGRNAAIIVERGGRIVAEGTRQAPVVLTCSRPPGERYPGCWGGLRILGRAPVTRLEGTAAGVRPAARAVYGGSDPHDSSGTLRYVRVEFAGAGSEPGSAAPAIGFHGVGDGTAIEHVQAHASLAAGIAFSGGTAACGGCVASGSGEAGLAWERGWRGSAAHLYVQHGPGGGDGIAGGNDGQGYDLEPRSLPALAHVTLAHSAPYGTRARKAAGLRLGTGSGVIARDLLVTGFGGGAIAAGQRAALLLRAGESSVAALLLHRNGLRPGRGQLRGGIAAAVAFIDGDPKLRDMRYFANPDPRPKASSPALKPDQGAEPGTGPAAEPASEQPPKPRYIGAFGKDGNWLEEWTFFGPESSYDTRELDGQP